MKFIFIYEYAGSVEERHIIMHRRPVQSIILILYFYITAHFGIYNKRNKTFQNEGLK